MCSRMVFLVVRSASHRHTRCATGGGSGSAAGTFRCSLPIEIGPQSRGTSVCCERVSSHIEPNIYVICMGMRDGVQWTTIKESSAAGRVFRMLRKVCVKSSSSCILLDNIYQVLFGFFFSEIIFINNVCLIRCRF